MTCGCGTSLFLSDPGRPSPTDLTWFPMEPGQDLARRIHGDTRGGYYNLTVVFTEISTIPYYHVELLLEVSRGKIRDFRSDDKASSSHERI